MGKVAYRLAFPPELSAINNVFLVSMIKKCVLDPSQVLARPPLALEKNLNYEEIPEKVLERQEKKLRKRSIPMVKVKWRNHSEREATWEIEEDVKGEYPSTFNFEDQISQGGWIVIHHFLK